MLLRWHHAPSGAECKSLRISAWHRQHGERGKQDYYAQVDSPEIRSCGEIPLLVAHCPGRGVAHPTLDVTVWSAMPMDSGQQLCPAVKLFVRPCC